jgi:hypothetical protein
VSDVKASILVFFLLSAATAAQAASGAPVQMLPLPAITAAPTPAPMPPPVNPGFAAAPTGGISPLLLQPGPAFPLPQQSAPRYPSLALPGPIDQQKISSYRLWLSSQLRLFERSQNPDDYLGRELQQQLLQLDETGAGR